MVRYLIKNYGVWILFFVGIVACESDGVTDSEAAGGTQSETESPALFSLIDASNSGIAFENTIEPTHTVNPMTFDYLFNGAGVAVGDVNGDELPDIYFTGNQVPDRLYVNKGDFKFEDVTSAAGIQGENHWTNGVNMVDVNGDGYLDIYVCRGGKFANSKNRSNLLYINDGSGKFKESASQYGLSDEGYSTQSYFFDADQDGDLDALILNRPNAWYYTLDELKTYRKKLSVDEQDHFYLNQNGKFQNVSYQAGFSDNYGFSLSASIEDLDNDGLLDIYIANDYLQNDYFYRNLGGGKFKEDIRSLTNHTPFYAMGSDFRDLNNDGYPEGIVVEMLPKDYKRAKTTMIPMMDTREFESVFGNELHHQYMHNAVYHNNQNGFYTDIAHFTGMTSTDWSWSAIAEDLDNDGWKDVYITNGYRYDANDRDAYAKFAQGYRDAIDVNRVDVRGKSVQEVYKPENLVANPPNPRDLLKPLPSNPIKNYVFRNHGEYSFSNEGENWGLATKGFSNGAAIADFDLDGDLDVVVNNIDQKAWLYENQSNNDHYIRFSFSGREGNIFGVGAEITLTTDRRILTNRMTPTRGYLSSSEYVCHFGTGGEAIISGMVNWPDGKTQTLSDLVPGNKYQIEYNPDGEYTAEKVNPLLVETTTRRLEKKFVHQEDYFFDYQNQVLIPHKFSQEGPVVVVGDINSDGREDFYVGGAAGFSGALFYQKPNGKFVEKTPAIISGDKEYEDGGADFLDMDGDGDLDLFVASGSNQFDLNNTKYIDRLYVNEGGVYTSKSKLPMTNVNGAVVDGFDLDGDNISEIFIGGGALFDAYPYPATSCIYKKFPEGLSDVSPMIAKDLASIGIVRDGQFADLDGSPPLELVLTGEWMPIKVLGFDQSQGLFVDRTAEYGLQDMTGWWFSLTFADIDKDGDQDIIAGNLGENYKFHASPEKSFKVFADDFDQNGTYDVFLAKQLDDDRMVPIRGKDCTSEQMPNIGSRFPTFNEFADANVDEIIGTKTPRTIEFEAKTFTSYIFENKGAGQKMIPHRLPDEAQWSTLRSAEVSDFNNDGNLDILIAGNMFPVEPETTRADGSPGYVLINKGNWKFDALTPKESGFFVPEDVRHTASIKIGNKEAFIVTVNSGELRIFEKAN